MLREFERSAANSSNISDADFSINILFNFKDLEELFKECELS